MKTSPRLPAVFLRLARREFGTVAKVAEWVSTESGMKVSQFRLWEWAAKKAGRVPGAEVQAVMRRFILARSLKRYLTASVQAELAALVPSGNGPDATEPRRLRRALDRLNADLSV